jgi:hypothetical protein
VAVLPRNLAFGTALSGSRYNFYGGPYAEEMVGTPLSEDERRRLMIRLFREAADFLESNGSDPPPEGVIDLIEKIAQRKRPPAA